MTDNSKPKPPAKTAQAGAPAQPAAPANTRAPQAPRRGARVLPLLVAVLLGMLVGRLACAPSSAPAPREPQAAGQAATWTCSMHPQIQLPGPGPCPICGMDLVPLADDADDGLHPRQLRISANAAALADIVTASVERRAATRDVRLVGRVTFDDTRLAYITAWVPSRIDRLFVDSSGVRVREGDHLVEVYSPELITTQQELLSAVRSAEQLTPTTAEVIRDRYAEAVVSARERLRSWGLLDDQIEEIIARGEPLQHVTIRAPVGGIVVEKNALVGEYVQTGTRIYTIADLTAVWVELDAYESDLAWLHYGQHVEIGVDAYPGETFRGRISLIDPVLDDRTRTVKVRVNVANADLRLKPDMFVRAQVAAPMTASGRLVDAELAEQWMCPMHPEVVAGEAGAVCEVCGMDLVPTSELGFHLAQPGELPLVVPSSAPLVTGERAVVYVRLPGSGPPVFEGREVVLGPRAGDVWVVREGLSEGDRVVVNGAFKLDSELQIRARPSMMNPEGGGDGHAHADHDEPGGAAPPVTRHEAPAAFRAALGALLPPLGRATAALAADDGAGARAALPALREALQAVPMQALDAEAHAAWMPLADTLGDGLDALGLEDIAAQRAGLFALSDALITTLDTFGWESLEPAVAAPGVFFCPMAFDGDGGRWIDSGDTVRNPYFGAAMLRCGERTRDLPREP